MRPIDQEKIKRIRKEARALIVEKGYHGASIAAIAKRANVSDGYLYRHYGSKTELVSDILERQLKEFHDYIFDLLTFSNSAKELIAEIVKFLFKLSEEEPTAIAFAHMLVYDHEFEYPKSRHDAINKLSSDIVQLGLKTGEFAKETREIDVMITVFTIPVKFIEYTKKGYGVSFDTKENEIQSLVDICIKALK